MAQSNRKSLHVLCLHLCFTVGLAQYAFPDTDSFLRAAQWRATVIDEYIYLDGGRVSHDVDKLDPIGSTLSIDCSTSWSPNDVNIRAIPRADAMRVLGQQAIFTDQASKSFYVWGGYLVDDEEPDYSTLWRFGTDGEGGGQWNSEAPSNQEVFLGLDVTEKMAYTSTDDGGLAFGGKILGPDGVPNSTTEESAKGFVTFNFTTKDWTHEDSGPYSHEGSIFGASATFVDRFGARGVIVLLGGLERANQPGSGYVDWGTIHVYDVAEKKWHSQKALGDAPSRRSHHCAVGVAGTAGNGSYEIFIYGGTNNDQGTDHGDVHALSLPGFTWTQIKGEEDGRERTDHVCVNVGGNSRLISLGGITYQESQEREWYDKDRYPRGIAIFNMNNMSWADSYEADADYYMTHEDIRSWYDQGGMNSVNWTDSEVRAVFTSNIPDGSESGGSGSDEGETGDSSPTPVGAIVGGTIGGVCGLATVGIAAWFFLRRRRRTSKFELPTEQIVKPLPHKSPSELHPNSLPAELVDPRTVAELDS